MPVRSFNSVVLKWPRREEALAAARSWAEELRADATVEAVYCVGSCARGDYGVGSDVDLLVIVRASDLPPVQRYVRFSPNDLPVPFDLWVLTRAEWEQMAEVSPLLRRRIDQEKLDLWAPQ